VKEHDDLSDGVGWKYDRHLLHVSVVTSVCSRDEGIVQILATFSVACLHASIVLNMDCALNADN
jgi:hypothetical protein